MKKQSVAIVSCIDTDTDTEGSDSEASDAASLDSDIAQEQEKNYNRQVELFMEASLSSRTEWSVSSCFWNIVFDEANIFLCS